MTQEQFIKASKLQTEIKEKKNRNEELEKIINLLKENSKKGYLKPDIRIQLNDTWNPIKGIVDYHDLINFLIQQRIKNEDYIKEMVEAFDNI